MPVLLSDSAAQAAEKLIDRRVDELGPEKILGVAFGEVTVEDWDAMRELRQALKQRTVNGNENGHAPPDESEAHPRVAIGRHAYDYLASLDLGKSARSMLENVKLSKTLIGIELSDETAAQRLVEALRSGSEDARSHEDGLAAERLERAAERIAAAL